MGNNTLLSRIGINQARTSFVASYLAETPQDELTEKGLGIALSAWAEYDGIKLMRVFREALEDSNFSTETAVVDGWIEAAEKI
jgi:hypothetical protein